ncbi:unnamed protein product, partial [Meganyctiphanes norvegica]
MSKLKVPKWARHSAQSQRRAIEEQLSIECIWKPMAAMMKEKSIDKLYWNPCVYNSNLTQITTQAVKTSPKQSGSVRMMDQDNNESRICDVNVEKPQESKDNVSSQSMEDELGNTFKIRKKKLSSSRRGSKSIADDSFTENIEEDNPYLYSYNLKQVTTQSVKTSPTQLGSVRMMKLIRSQGMVKHPVYGSTIEVKIKVRKKKKRPSSRRKGRLKVNKCITKEMIQGRTSAKEVNSSAYCQDDSECNSRIVSEALLECDELEDHDDNESKIHEIVEISHENKTVVSPQSVEEEQEKTAKVRRKTFRSSRARAISDDSITENVEEDNGSTVKVRKKKLSSSRSRDKLWAQKNNGSTAKEDNTCAFCQDDSEHNPRVVSESAPDDDDECGNQDNNESRICGLKVEKPHECKNNVSSQSMEEEPGNTVKVRKMKLSSSRRGSKSIADDSITENIEEDDSITQNIGEDDGSIDKVRKRKVSTTSTRKILWT